MVSKVEMWVFDTSCITQPQSQIATDIWTLVVGWPHRSQKYGQLGFNDALNVTARCSYELCCQSLFDSVAA